MHGFLVPERVSDWWCTIKNECDLFGVVCQKHLAFFEWWGAGMIRVVVRAACRDVVGRGVKCASWCCIGGKASRSRIVVRSSRGVG